MSIEENTIKDDNHASKILSEHDGFSLSVYESDDDTRTIFTYSGLTLREIAEHVSQYLYMRDIDRLWIYDPVASWYRNGYSASLYWSESSRDRLKEEDEDDHDCVKRTILCIMYLIYCTRARLREDLESKVMFIREVRNVHYFYDDRKFEDHVLQVLKMLEEAYPGLVV